MQTNILPAKLRIFSGSALKLIAIFAMFIDHFATILQSVLPVLNAPLITIGAKTLPVYAAMHMLGRMAFPIFCFLIAEGFFHTRSKPKYGLRLLVFALVSEIPFNLMASNHLFYFGGQNVFFTLFFGVALLYIYENVSHLIKKALCMAAILTLTVVLRTDYSLRGALLILLLYILRSHPVEKTLLAFPFLPSGIYAFAAFIPINMYNGTRGFVRSKAFQYGFYLFYPLHILLLYAIKLLLMRG